MHRKFLPVISIFVFVLFAAAAHSNPLVADWQPSGALVSRGDTAVPPVMIRAADVKQVNTEYFGKPQELLKVNPAEREKDQFPEMELIPSSIPQHTVVVDGSAGSKSMSSMAQPLAPVRQKSFTALSQTRFYPPDPAIAAGPTHVIACVNVAIAFYTKTGGKKFQSTFELFFSRLAESKGTTLFDPRVVYDQYSQHFIIVVAGIRTIERRSWYFLAVSKTSNPEGEWGEWALDMGLNGKTKTSNWADFPGVGFDEKGIYLTGNMFNFATDNFSYAKIRVLDKAKVYQFGNFGYADFFNLKDATGVLAFTIQPAHQYGTFDREFLISSNEDHGTKLTLWTIQNPSAPKPALVKKAVVVSAFKYPPDAPQKGGGALINTGDARFGTHCIASGGFIYAAHPIGFKFGTQEVSAIRLYQLTPAGQVVQSITYGADKFFYYYPALEVDPKGNIVLVFNRSGSNEFVGIHYTGRKSTDPAGKLQSSAALKVSTANYLSVDDSGRNRWGDYNTAALDPSDGSVWIYSEFAVAGGNWSTQVGKVKFN